MSQFDHYAMHFPQTSSATETVPSTVHNNKSTACYGFSWMACAVEEWKAADCLKTGPRDELDAYLDSQLEKLGDDVNVITWWGVSL